MLIVSILIHRWAFKRKMFWGAFFFISNLLIHVYLAPIPEVRLYVHNLHLYCWRDPDGITITLLQLWNLKEAEHVDEHIALLYPSLLTCLCSVFSP